MYFTTVPVSRLSFISCPLPHFRPRHLTHPRRATTATLPSPPAAEPRTLYLVSTPIGNPNDLTLRARSILSTVDLIFSEDTRVTGLLLSQHAVKVPRLLSCHAHNSRQRLPLLLSSLQTGLSAAYVCDAGTPCISDPGHALVSAAIAANLSVVPIPGPCAALAALTVSGHLPSPFLFLAFLPQPSSSKAAVLRTITQNPNVSIVLYEAPHRLLATLSTLSDVSDIAQRPVCIARELTKKYEQFLRFTTLPHARDHYLEHAPRGEFTLILAPCPPPPKSQPSIHDYNSASVDVPALVEALVRSGMAPSTVARTLSATTSVPKKLLYAHATSLKHLPSST